VRGGISLSNKLLDDNDNLTGNPFGWQSIWLAINLAGNQFGWQSIWLAINLAGNPFGWQSIWLTIYCSHSIWRLYLEEPPTTPSEALMDTAATLAYDDSGPINID
jgi:hypothetical protein